MGYSAEVMQRARARLAAAKADRESENRQHLEEAYTKLPRLREIDRQLRLTMAMAAQAVFSKGGDVNEALEEARKQNLALQKEREVLIRMYFEEGYLDDSPICDRCGGSGYVGAAMCRCLATLCLEEQRRELAELTTGKERFSGFRLDYYPEAPDRTVGVSPQRLAAMDFLLISISHFHCTDFTIRSEGAATAEGKARALLDKLEQMDLTGVKIMWTNYPNMPTGASASEELYARLVDFGRRHGILICNDNPYSFILNDNPLSILAQPGAKECCLELNSLSKAHNMAGWRIGMVAADAEVITEILKVKSQMDSGMFKPLQLAAVEALSQGPEWFEDLNAEYRRRRVLAGEIFDLIGAEYDHESSGMFLWGRIKTSVNSIHQTSQSIGEQTSDRLLYEAGVFITPGFIFGKNGENYVRISLCAKPEVLKRAAEKIRNVILNEVKDL